MKKPTLEQMQAACTAVVNGEDFDKAAMQAAAATLGMMAECPDALRAVVHLARRNDDLKRPEVIAEILKFIDIFREVYDARLVIREIKDAFPGAEITEIVTDDVEEAA